jgi:DNA invertase Pin-like site-specific DNA recombinase
MANCCATAWEDRCLQPRTDATCRVSPSCDVLTVTKPDRLARSTAELLSSEVDLSERGIGLVVLSMGGERLDTRNPTP